MGHAHGRRYGRASPWFPGNDRSRGKQTELTERDKDSLWHRCLAFRDSGSGDSLSRTIIGDGPNVGLHVDGHDR
jgi:hypothetical protein